MTHVIEPGFNNWILFFALVGEVNGGAMIRYCPRPKNGGDKAKGFQFEVPSIWQWSDFYKFIQSDEFVKTFWIDYRFGDSPEKMWWRILDFFQPVFSDCPFEKVNGNEFCKRALPVDLSNTLTLKGVDLQRNYW